ncbi:MAG: cytochrome P450 [Solirubrobacteraceae bacterium]
MTIETPTAAPQVAPPAALAPRLPPGPRLPRALQTVGFILGGERFLELCRRRYGGAVFMRTLFDNGFVMVFDPELVKQLFQGPHGQLNAGEANALLGPILGGRSVLVLDGDEHLRHRKLMLPPFHGRRMQLYEDAVTSAADAEIDSWPIGTSFPLLPTLQSLTLRVIVRAVFGYVPGAAEEELRRRLRAMVTPVAQPRGLLSLFVLPRLGFDRGQQRFAEARDAVDELLYAEIEARRAQPDLLQQRDDVFSALLLATDEYGERLSPEEVRDELVTLLIAGHETTATGLAWTFDLLLHNPAVLQMARSGDDNYLDAVVKESLRLRPVIPGVGRVVRGEPFALGEWLIPDGIEINPSIRIIHRRDDLYPHASEFRPERYLGADPPDTYTWVPFGGGTRRCLGASFAQMEMRVALRRILERATLRPASSEPDPVQFRAITLAPKHGVRVIQDSVPRITNL